VHSERKEFIAGLEKCAEEVQEQRLVMHAQMSEISQLKQHLDVGGGLFNDLVDKTKKRIRCTKFLPRACHVRKVWYTDKLSLATTLSNSKTPPTALKSLAR
jgi:hypothetical protein